MEDKNAILRLLREDKEQVSVMASMVEKALGHAIEALKQRDLSMAHQLIAEDAMIDEKRMFIEKFSIELVATQRPNTSDLNSIVAVLNIINELERIGDYATGIAKIVIMIGDEPPLKPLIDIPRMCDITTDMVHNSIKAFLDDDYKVASHVIGMDEVVDSIYDQIFRELLTFMMTDPKTINRATRLIWVAHNIERAADRATNISDRVIYTLTGKTSGTAPTIY